MVVTVYVFRELNRWEQGCDRRCLCIVFNGSKYDLKCASSSGGIQHMLKTVSTSLEHTSRTHDVSDAATKHVSSRLHLSRSSTPARISSCTLRLLKSLK